MKNGWQLAVVDVDAFSYTKCSALIDRLRNLFENSSPMPCGTIVYICSTMQCSAEKFGQEWRSDYLDKLFAHGIPFANVWMPAKKKYGFAPLYVLRPIATEADVIEVEMKFGISLKEYMQ